ncbi:MAG: DUF4352 domain-containing protein [Parcubacteria group bacterium]|nr:DUF4352 domain-containing protein [Parcubacteria group bacterium]
MSKDSRDSSKNWFAKHKILTGIGAVIIFFIFIGAIGGDSSPTSNTGSSGDSNKSEATVSYSLNDEVTVGEVKWVVTDAYSKTSLSGAFGGSETTQGKFIVINATVENLGSDMKSTSNLKLVDNKGREFTNSSSSFKNLGAEQLFILENLNPNLPFTFADVYEVPADAEGFSLIVGDLSLFGSKEAKISLGF